MTMLCITPNPAVDVTYRLDRLELHGVNRVREKEQRPGGKGVNVARLLAARGADVSSYGFTGGASGRLLRTLLTTLQPSIQQEWTPVDSETRQTIAVVDDVDTTMLNEPGPPVSDADWERLLTAVVQDCRPGDVVTVSGSLPTGSDPAHVARIVAAARRRGAITIVDISGPALVAAARAGAQVVKPNRDELLDATGAATVDDGAAVLLSAGCEAVVTSLGADGLALRTSECRYTARLNRALSGNPTGAGDAVVAALAAGLADTSPEDRERALVDALARAVGWSAAAVLSPVAGEIDLNSADQLLNDVTTKEL